MPNLTTLRARNLLKKGYKGFLSRINTRIYSERQKYGINSLKIKQIFFQKNLCIGQF
jgi:hypothetical protein